MQSYEGNEKRQLITSLIRTFLFAMLITCPSPLDSIGSTGYHDYTTLPGSSFASFPIFSMIFYVIFFYPLLISEYVYCLQQSWCYRFHDQWQ